MNPSSWWWLGRMLGLSIPLVFGLGALLVSPAKPFRWALLAAKVAGALALAAAPLAAVPSARVDVVTSTMLVLVGVLAVVIVRFSRTYLQGDAGQVRYVRALLGTLAAVTLLVVARHLLVMALAWTATSFLLHALLTFYGDRPAALMAAHKKFLLSRLADACVLGGVGLIGVAVGSLDIDDVRAWAGAQTALPTSVRVAAVLLVAGVALRSAQVPFHGWLTQVMEAPTPVSALLHAGIVNVGGYVLIRLSPLMARADEAQLLLVAIGTTTTVVAALIMTTRVSIKVALAWSTCAQMGFMLIECGLGLWHLALLHLVAHSLYKAHAFLASGSTVEAWRAAALGRRAGAVSIGRVLGALAVLAGVAAVVALRMPELRPAAALVALAVAPLLARGIGARGFAPIALRGLGVAALYVGWHLAFGRFVPHSDAPAIAWAIAGGGMTLLFALQTVLQAWPHGRLARALQPHLFAGLYLDELFTRTTFRVWPPRLPTADVPRAPLPLVAGASEVRA